MFLPKIKLFEETMILANLGGIIEAKHHSRRINTQPDYELYLNLLNDPTAHLCSETSAIQDIKHRFHIQQKLWENVLSLRQGIYYSDKFSDLRVAINNCKNNLYDSPDLTYVQDEGTFLRRLLNTFSIRPTIISTTNMAQTNELADPTGFTYNSLNMMNISQLTSIPIITVRVQSAGVNGNAAPINLTDSMNQLQWFKEGNMIVPKQQSILHSREVLIFYVSRRYQTISLARANPCNFSRLPTTVAGWEVLNTNIVDFTSEITVATDVFDLRSVVMVETDAEKLNLIIGTTSAVIIPDYVGNAWNNTYDKTVLFYDPVGAGILTYRDNNPVNNTPVTWIEYEKSLNSDKSASLQERACMRGTIFIYQKRVVNDCIASVSAPTNSMLTF